MSRRTDVVPAVTRWFLVLIVCLVGSACARDRAAVKPAPAPPVPPPAELVQPGPVHVPDLFGLTHRQAVTHLYRAGLTPEVRSELAVNFQLSGMHCRVLAQNPLPGARVAPGTRVALTVYMPVGTCE